MDFPRKIQTRKQRKWNSQLLAELRRVLWSAKRVDEPLKGGHGGVDLEDPGGDGLSRVLLAIDAISPQRRGAARLEIPEAHYPRIIENLDLTLSDKK